MKAAVDESLRHSRHALTTSPAITSLHRKLTRVPQRGGSLREQHDDVVGVSPRQVAAVQHKRLADGTRALVAAVPGDVEAAGSSAAGRGVAARRYVDVTGGPDPSAHGRRRIDEDALVEGGHDACTDSPAVACSAGSAGSCHGGRSGLRIGGDSVALPLRRRRQRVGVQPLQLGASRVEVAPAKGKESGRGWLFCFCQDVPAKYSGVMRAC